MADSSAAPIKIGILGTGHMGRIHLRLLRSNPNFEVVAVYDPDTISAGIVEQDYALKSASDAQAVADQADALVIASPTLTHAEYALQFVRQGKHLLLEKPVTADPEDAKKLVALVEEAGVTATVNHVERFNPALQAVLERDLAPMFLEVHRLAQWNPRGADVSVVYDLMIHDIDIVLKLVAAGVKRVSASGVPVITDTPDICTARIEFHNGAVANLTASRISLKKMRRMRLFQPNQYLTVDFLEKKTEVFSVQDEAPEGGALELKMGDRTRYILGEQPAVDTDANALVNLHDAFATAIRTRTAPPVTVHDAYRALATAKEVEEKIAVTAAL